MSFGRNFNDSSVLKRDEEVRDDRKEGGQTRKEGKKEGKKEKELKKVKLMGEIKTREIDR